MWTFSGAAVTVCVVVPCSPLSFAVVLLELLSSLRDSVIPSAYYPLEDFKAFPLATW